MTSKAHQNDLWRSLDSTKSEIRVIEISPAKFRRDVIVCYLRTVSLSDKPEYEALSYVWGGTSGKRHILVDGNRMPVTKNLFAALECLRDAEKTRILWIDALCINQTNDTEKNIQVAMMGRIYSQASKVLVWLLQYELPGLLDDMNSRCQNPEAHLTKLPSWLLTLLDDGWWHRAWTFQEAALANNLIFHTGGIYFSVEDLEQYYHSAGWHLFQRNSCCSVLFDKECADRIRRFVETFSMIRGLLSNRGINLQGKRRLLDLILDNRYRLATKPQDTVYAYLGLVRDAPLDFVKYELSLRDWNLHTSTKFIQHNMSLKIVSLANRSGYLHVAMSRTHGLPTWCPDWTLSVDPTRISIMRNRQLYINAGKFAASGRTKTNPCFPAPKILGVSGVVCDKVAHVADDYVSQETPNDVLRVLRQWYRFVANNASVYNARCGNCNKLIYGIRRTCLTCPDYDFCCRCFGNLRDIHPGHSFSNIRSPEIDMAIVKDFSWETFSEIAYPFSDSDTLQDAFRKVITTEGNIDVLFSDSSKYGIDGQFREARIFLEMAFAKFWHLKIENRPEADFVIDGQTIEPGSPESRALTEDNIDYISSMVHVLLWKKVFFMSSKGYIGWGPLGMEVGDTIAVLHGGDMPFVLREFPKMVSVPEAVSGYNYFVLGDCYAPGLMKGEALENEEMENRDFLLH